MGKVKYAPNKKAKKAGGGSNLIFDPNERVEFVKGFSKRKQERKELARKAMEEEERKMRILLRKKRKEAKEKSVKLASKHDSPPVSPPDSPTVD